MKEPISISRLPGTTSTKAHENAIQRAGQAPLNDAPANAEAAPTALLDRIERALRHGELDDSALAELIQRLGAARRALRGLVEALDQFDFELALKALQALR